MDSLTFHQDDMILFQLRKEIERNTTEDIVKKDIHNLLGNQMKTLAQKFTSNIDIFRYVYSFTKIYT